MKHTALLLLLLSFLLAFISPRPVAASRENKSIRLGGYFTHGSLNIPWISSHFDLLIWNHALYKSTNGISNISDPLTPATVRLLKENNPGIKLFLYLTTRSIFEVDGLAGSVGGWEPTMYAWVLKDGNGNEIPSHWANAFGEPAHYMDFAGDEGWAKYWAEQAAKLVSEFGVDGVAADELAVGFHPRWGTSLQSYPTEESIRNATETFLTIVREITTTTILPTSLGFYFPAARGLGTLWDQYDSLLNDGVFNEHWVRQYAIKQPVPLDQWLDNIRSAEDYSRRGRLYLAMCEFDIIPSEVEYCIASYLLAKQSDSLILQPFVTDLGFDLNPLIEKYPLIARYLDIELGMPQQDRTFDVPSGIWWRNFEKGIVVVNPDTQPHAITFNRDYFRLDGSRVRLLTLSGQTGAILLTQPPLAGDLNGDGKVDISDYNLLKQSFGNPYTIFDLNQLVANFGKVQ